MSAAPILNLRMKSNRSTPPSDRFQSLDDLEDILHIMMKQDESPSYKCRDYLLRRKVEQKEAGQNGDNSRSSTPTLLSEVDTLCREKMCEWAYRVVDHFQASREIVAIAFCYLDIFLGRCCCDRSAFKLAAMTSIYMATKIFNSREISMSSLAELSRGEFDIAHISQMEGIILHTLEWRLHPPTAQCFINYFHALLPLPKGALSRAVYQRSSFFAELSLFDYSFVSQSKCAIAVAALMNAMEGMEGTVSKKDQEVFYESICKITGHVYPINTIDSIRGRLWYVYSQSDQFRQEDTHPIPQRVPSEACIPTQPIEKGNHGGDSSPVSVSVVTGS